MVKKTIPTVICKLSLHGPSWRSQNFSLRTIKSKKKFSESQKNFGVLPTMKALLRICYQICHCPLWPRGEKINPTSAVAKFGQWVPKWFWKYWSKQNQGEVMLAWCLCSKGILPPVISVRRGEKVFSGSRDGLSAPALFLILSVELLQAWEAG